MARSDPTIYMRIPQELKDQLDAEAAKNRRSVTAEVVDRLQRSFLQRSDADLAPYHEATEYMDALRAVIETHAPGIDAEIKRLREKLSK